MNRIMLLISLLSMAATSAAHTRWILPSHTMLSGDKPHIVTFDLSISTELYHADFILFYESETQSPIYLDVTLPDGQVVKSNPLSHYHRKSVLAEELGQTGSYRFELIPRHLEFKDYYLPNDDRMYRAWGALPEKAVNVTDVIYKSRLTTFVSRNGISDIKPTGKGLELAGAHPNELFSEESSTLQLLLDGNPVEGVTAILLAGGTRYRNERNKLVFETDKNGQFEVTWPTAGMYLLEVEHDVPIQGNQVERYATYVTLEVMPF